MFVGDTGCRFMCASETSIEAVDRFVADIERVGGSGRLIPSRKQAPCHAFTDQVRGHAVEPRRAIVVALAAALPLGAFAHHGWSEYDSTHTAHADGHDRGGGLRAPARLHQAEDASEDMGRRAGAAVANRKSRPGEGRAEGGATATVEGYANRDKAEEMRAERITVAGKTTDFASAPDGEARSMRSKRPASGASCAIAVGLSRRRDRAHRRTRAAVRLIVVVDLRLVGLGRGVPATKLAALSVPWTLVGFLMALCSGLLMSARTPRTFSAIRSSSSRCR